MKMKNTFLALTAITILIFGSYFVSDSFAIDYRDSTGYTPSWAIGQGYHYVLNECNYLTGDYSSDGNWCMEWVAYVLDQGVENFPESTKSSSSSTSISNLSERICSENKICAFPGEFLKYKNTDTYDNFSEIAIIEFKNKIDTNSIQFFSDGFGSKPLTYNLNLNTGIETNDEYTNVNRPFNLLEPIPMKIGQEVSQYMEGYYESTISTEQTVNLKELGLMDVTRVLMMAKTDLGGGDTVIRVYDKETGVLITNVEKYHLDGKEYTSGMVLTDTNIFSVPTKLTSTETSIPKIPEQSTPKIESSTAVPGWVKNNASWWADGQIDDEAFVQGIQYLVEEKIINVIVPTSQSSSTDQKVPDWIRNNAKWWADGMISEDDFLKGIQYLVESGIINVENTIQNNNVSENYHKAVILINEYCDFCSNDFPILTIIDPDLNKDKNMLEVIDLDQISVTINGVKMELSDLNPISKFEEIEPDASIFQIAFSIGDDGANLQNGDVIKFEYVDDTLYSDVDSGQMSVSLEVIR